LLAEATFR